MAAAKTIAIDTKTLAKPIGETVNIKVGGTVYEAHCPKDSVLMRMRDDDSDSFEVISRAYTGMVGTQAGAEIVAMLDDPDNREVTLEVLSRMLQWLLESPDGPQWGKAIEESVKDLGSGETPRTVATARKAPARTAKRTATRRR